MSDSAVLATMFGRVFRIQRLSDPHACSSTNFTPVYLLRFYQISVTAALVKYATPSFAYVVKETDKAGF